VAASSLSRSANRSVRALPLILIIAVGVALRLYLIADKSLWLDESFSIWMGRQPIGAMWRYLVQLDQHPPLYYTLLHFWMWLGDGEAIVRSFSALWSILTLPVIYAIGARIGGRRLGFLAALILALSPIGTSARRWRSAVCRPICSIVASWSQGWRRRRAPAG
jgi:uncharacterized membrane protein